jgi:rubrerythrin
MYKTDGNLQSAFAEECQAYVRYSLFAARADAEGFAGLASLFRAAAAAEMVHARNHFTVMGGPGSSRDNILAAATSEHYAITRIYPAFIEDARVDRNEHAQITFDYALKSEQVHNQIFEAALTTVKNGKSVENEARFICNQCGNLVKLEIPEKCSICGSTSDKFKQVA